MLDAPKMMKHPRMIETLRRTLTRPASVISPIEATAITAIAVAALPRKLAFNHATAEISGDVPCASISEIPPGAYVARSTSEVISITYISADALTTAHKIIGASCGIAELSLGKSITTAIACRRIIYCECNSLSKLAKGRIGSIVTALLTLAPTIAQAQELGDPAGSGAIVSAVHWLQGTLLGTVATVVAVIAVAVVGFLMLAGRINWRYGATVILGCFILFGATSIVAGIQSTASLGN